MHGHLNVEKVIQSLRLLTVFVQVPHTARIKQMLYSQVLNITDPDGQTTK